jgi:hypothetical protein
MEEPQSSYSHSSFSQTACLMKTVKEWSKRPEPYKEASMAALNIIILQTLRAKQTFQGNT